MTNTDPRELVRRYVAVWNEPDAELRRTSIRGLWAEDGAHILQPPQETQRARAWKSSCSTTTAASRPTISSSKADCRVRREMSVAPAAKRAVRRSRGCARLL